jgi:hypothetical protein
MGEGRGRGLAVESIVIVFSILLAFAIDAAWDSHRGREEEVRFLSAIDAEITRNLERIEGARRFRSAKRAASLELLELSARAGVDASKVDASRVDALIADLTWWDVGRWQTSAIDTLLTGGKLSLVDDQPLRQQLITLPRTIGSLSQVESQDEQTFRTRLMSHLIREASLPQISNAIVDLPPGFLPDQPDAEGSPYGKIPAAVPKDHRKLLESSEFLGIVTKTYWDQNDVLFMLDVTKDRLIGVRAAIRAQLGERPPAAAERGK